MPLNSALSICCTRLQRNAVRVPSTGGVFKGTTPSAECTRVHQTGKPARASLCHKTAPCLFCPAWLARTGESRKPCQTILVAIDQLNTRQLISVSTNHPPSPRASPATRFSIIFYARWTAPGQPCGKVSPLVFVKLHKLLHQVLLHEQCHLLACTNKMKVLLKALISFIF